MNQDNQQAYLRALTRKQLIRLFTRILERIDNAFGPGGKQYGIDLPTMQVCYPAWYDAYMLVRKEGHRRTREGQVVSQ